jgi:hypothetical protein
MRQLDTYFPHYPTQLSRAFDATMEIPQKDVETLFKGLLSSSEVKEVAAFIESRLGRKLEPFDIWYNGFKARGGIPEEQLTAITSKKYPNPKALETDLPNILVKLGWKPDRAREISSLIVVDPSRGAGHAWGATMRNDIAHLRTRIGAGGMDYKGYNIAVHEFGHTVEQTITMNDVDYYVLNGVPNTAFTEAVAFLFQKRDLELLGLKNPNPEDEHYLALDNFWSSYEIMGVSHGGYPRLGMALQPSGCHSRSIERSGYNGCKRCVGHLLCRYFGREGRDASRDLLAHDRLPALSTELSDGTPH